jgi:hypothetical protein
MFLVTSKNIIKYVIYSIVIIGILSFLTKNKLTRSEFLMVALPIIALYIILDSVKNVSTKMEKFSMLDKSSSLSQSPITPSPKTPSPKSPSPKSPSPKSPSPKSPSPKSPSKADLKNTATTKEISIIGDELRKLYNALFKKLSDSQAYSKMLEFTKNTKLIKKVYTEKIIKNIEKFSNVDKGFPKLSPTQEQTLIKSLAKTITEVKAGLKSTSKKPIPKTIPTKTSPKTMKKIIKSAIKEVVKGGISGTEVEGDSDWKYNTFNPKRMRPLGEGLQEWQNDYVLLNTDKWAPSLVDPPVCKKEKSCPVCPNMSFGYAKQYTTLADFNSSRKVKGPDDINLKYLEKLNRGE